MHSQNEGQNLNPISEFSNKHIDDSFIDPKTRKRNTWNEKKNSLLVEVK
jgi:hypothetical protein